MITRRSFLTKSATVAVVATTSPYIFASGSTLGLGNYRLKKFGYISNIIDKELKGDWKAILKKTVEFGFSEIETGEYLGDSAAGFLSYCNSIGLKPVTGGINFSATGEELTRQMKALNIFADYDSDLMFFDVYRVTNF
jgi:hypothetical protein